jgi:hypothetical protein
MDKRVRGEIKIRKESSRIYKKPKQLTKQRTTRTTRTTNRLKTALAKKKSYFRTTNLERDNFIFRNIQINIDNKHAKCKNPSETVNCFKKIKNINVGQIIGEGTYGTIYKAIGTYRNKEITFVIKSMKACGLDLSHYVKEVSYHYQMDINKIGPKIYDSFFSGNENKEVHYIALEYFDMDVQKLLDSTKKDTEKISAIKQMTCLIKKQISTGLDCSDIKPANFLYNTKTKTVKMTDFGGDFCSMLPESQLTANKEFIVFRNNFILYSVMKQTRVSPFVLKKIVNLLKKSDIFLEQFYLFLKEDPKNAKTFVHYTKIYLNKSFINNIKNALKFQLKQIAIFQNNGKNQKHSQNLIFFSNILH